MTRTPSHFFAYLSRMRFIRRWGLMRNTSEENIQEHSLQTVFIAHALALIATRVFHREVNAERVMALAAFHEVGEVITGDLPSPIKYHDPELRTAYARIERSANERLLQMLPQELREAYCPLLLTGEGEEEHLRLVKAADKLCAYLKCVEELKGGNQEFSKAKDAIERQLEEFDLPEVTYFLERFAPSFSLTLDELN